MKHISNMLLLASIVLTLFSCKHEVEAPIGSGSGTGGGGTGGGGGGGTGGGGTVGGGT